MAKDIMTSGIEMADVIKSTGFPVPEDMEGKTFAECVSGGGGGGGDSGSATAYAWKNTSVAGDIFYLSVDKATASSSDIKILYWLADEAEYKVSGFATYLEREGEEGTYTKVSDSQFQILWEGASEPDVYERVPEEDVIIWEGEGGGKTTAYAWHGYFEEAMHPQETDMGIRCFDFSSAPATQSDFFNGHTFDPDGYLNVITNEESFAWANITEYTVSEGAIHMITEVGNYRFVRESAKDLSIWEASGDITVEALTATENKVYTAPEGKAYSPVTVNVPSADLADNHLVTIDVGTYSAPVEITPPSGKDGFKKATVTLTDIPSPTTMYCWVDNLDPHEDKAFCVIPNPKVGDQVFWTDADGVYSIATITATTETTLTTDRGTVTRDSTEDIVLVN